MLLQNNKEIIIDYCNFYDSLGHYGVGASIEQALKLELTNSNFTNIVAFKIGGVNI